MTDAEFLNAEATMLTVSGRWMDLVHPDPSMILAEDIAHHLSLLCRFTGAVRDFYSVAEHSVLVSYMVPTRFAFQALMHDASEAYLNDIIRPVKRMPGMDTYRALEARMEEAISKRFGLPYPLAPEVKHADDLAVRIEKAILKGHGTCPDGYGIPGPWHWKVARKRFMKRYRELTQPRRVLTSTWF